MKFWVITSLFVYLQYNLSILQFMPDLGDFNFLYIPFFLFVGLFIAALIKVNFTKEGREKLRIEREKMEYRRRRRKDKKMFFQ